MLNRLVVIAGLLLATAVGAEAESDLKQFSRWLLQGDRDMEDLPFPEVIEATTGNKVLPVDEENPAIRRVLDLIARAADLTLREMNAPDSEARQTQRINEASRFFEDSLLKKLAAAPDLECSIPLTAEGRVQRSGYPDLRLLDRTTGTLYYLDPKVYAIDSQDSSFRTFYYSPKTGTSKVLQDAHHLVLGIAHETRPGGAPRFVHWKLLDLSHLRVRLKAEFEGSNRAMHTAEAVVAEGRNEAP